MSNISISLYLSVGDITLISTRGYRKWSGKCLRGKAKIIELVGVVVEYVLHKLNGLVRVELSLG